MGKFLLIQGNGNPDQINIRIGMLLAIGGTDDHVHLLLSIPPTCVVSEFVRQLKGASSHWVNHELNPGGRFAWQSGYAAFTLADILLDQVKAYIEHQEEHHAKCKINAALEQSGMVLSGNSSQG